jgi:transposase
MEVKLLALEALASGLSAQEVGELVGVGSGTIHKWRKDHAEGGVPAMCRKASSIAVRKQCSALEERIVALRQEHPDRGVRRIRDDLRRQEGLEVSAEKVRQVVTEAGLGNPPPQPQRRPPSVRRFERSCPNALWQIDIFTFHLKRMYPVYLIGAIDDHSRYLVGWVRGLAREDPVPEGAAPAGRAARAQRAAPSDDPGEDRALLADDLAGVSRRGGLRLLRRRLPKTRALDSLLQSPTSSPGH